MCIRDRNYPDAEVKIIHKNEFPEIKPLGFTMQAASIGKMNDDVFPIKTYKYFEDDPPVSYTHLDVYKRQSQFDSLLYQYCRHHQYIHKILYMSQEHQYLHYHYYIQQ